MQIIRNSAKLLSLKNIKRTMGLLKKTLTIKYQLKLGGISYKHFKQQT